LLAALVCGSGCGNDVSNRAKGGLTVTAIGTPEEVARVLQKANALDLNQTLRDKLLAMGLSRKTVNRLAIELSLAPEEVSGKSWLHMKVALRRPTKKSRLTGAYYSSLVYDGKVYDACRAIANELFARPTRSAFARPKSKYINCAPGVNPVDTRALFAELRGKIDELVARAQPRHRQRTQDEPPIVVSVVDRDRVILISYAEGWESEAEEVQDFIFHKAAASGWRAEPQ